MVRSLGYIMIILLLLTCVNMGSGNSLNFIQKTETTTGTIYGYTYQMIGWQVSPVSLVMVKLDNNYKLTDINGYYEFRFLSTGKTYNISVSKLLYIPQSYQITLTTDNPTAQVDFLLEYRDIFSSQPMISIFA